MKNPGYEFIDHTADVQVKSWGNNLEEAFAQTAYSLMATITPDLKKITPKIEKNLYIKAEDKEALLFDFLSEFLYIFDVEGLIFNHVKVEYIKKSNHNYELKAILEGEEFSKEKHEIGIEVKAITYSYMKIEENIDNVKINIIFDI